MENKKKSEIQYCISDLKFNIFRFYNPKNESFNIK